METFCFAVFVAAEPCVCRRHREISRHIFATKPDIFETMSVFVATEAAFESLSCGSLS